VNDACVHAACGSVQCAPQQVCHAGACLPDNCIEPACNVGFACVEGRCVDVGCLGVTCPAGGVCRQGRCIGADAGVPDAGQPDAGACATVGEGGACGPVTACRAFRCRGSACREERAADGTDCADAGLCQVAGRCAAGVCDQPPPTACRTGDLQVGLTWDTNGRDLELHLVRPGGRLNDTTNRTDCTWNTCQSSSPDWGVVGVTADNPTKDVDNTGTLGPENIALSGLENGSYAVFVEHWGAGTPSAAQVIIRVRGVTHTFNLAGLVSHHLWDVARVDGTSGAVTTRGQVVDCTATWSSGCLLMLP